MKMKTFFSLATIICLAIVLPGLIFAEGQAEEQEQVLNVPFDPMSTEAFDTPHWATGQGTTMIFSSLLFVDDDLIPGKGDLAESWDISADNTKFTFHLRDGLKWHDGEPLTAEDVAWTYKTLLLNSRKVPIITNALESLEGAKAYIDGRADNVKGIKVIDDKTIELTLSAPNAVFLNGLSCTYIIPKHLLKDENPERLHHSDFYMEPVGSGPYKIVRREPGNYTMLEAFEDYYAGEPTIKQVVFRSWDNPVPAAEAGEVDFMQTNDVTIGIDLMKIEHMEVTPVPMAYLRFMAIKVDTPPFDDVRVRKALYHAIDRKALAEDFFQGYAVPIDTNMYPGFWVNDELTPYDYNPEKAKQLLKEAGWDSDYVIDLIFYYNDQGTRDFMSAIQYYWSEVGAQCEPRLVTGDVTGIINEKRTYDIWYGATACTDPVDHLGRWLSNFNSGTGFQNARYDEVFQKASQTIDANKRKEYYDEAQALLHENVVTIPMYSPNIFIAQNKRLEKPFIESDMWWHHYYQWETWEFSE